MKLQNIFGGRKRTYRKVSRVRPVMRPDARSDDLADHIHNVYIITYVYFLKLTNGDIYKGLMGDLERRISEHEQGQVESTRNFLPPILIGYETYILKSDAERRERFLKTTEGRKLLRQQYRDILKL